ncbi:MAG: hypothetical protein CM15mP8_0790 [Methanobacteriota archaeon]|nr:MAG: hypothetical protein CM15mP8_0790 [Euryarchaeota archaeon]
MIFTMLNIYHRHTNNHHKLNATLGHSFGMDSIIAVKFWFGGGNGPPGHSYHLVARGTKIVLLRITTVITTRWYELPDTLYPKD